MKNKFLLLTIFLALCAGSASAQLRTVRNYHGWSGKLAEVYTVKAGTGIKHGNYKSYTDNGFLVHDVNYSNNVLHGAYKHYYGDYMSTHLQSSGSYNQGEQHGEWREWKKVDGGDFYLYSITTYYNGEEQAQKIYTPKGKLLKDVPYNGKFFDASLHYIGREEGTMKNGKVHGERTVANDDGVITERGNWNEGRREGTTTQYYADGTKYAEAEYKPFEFSGKWSSKLVGVRSEWDRNGKQSSITDYSRDGKETILSQTKFTYDDAGNLITETTTDRAKDTKTITAYDPKTGAKLSVEERKNSSNAFAGKVIFHPNGSKRVEAFGTPVDGVIEKQYYDDGALQVVFHTDGSRERYYRNGKIMRKIFVSTDGRLPYYAEYDETGNKTEEGFLDKSYKVLEATYYKDGVKDKHTNEQTGLETNYNSDGTIAFSRNKKTKITLIYAPEGHLECGRDENANETFYDASGCVTAKSRISNRDYDDNSLPSFDYVRFYTGGTVREKGVNNIDGERVGKWYLYSEKGKLSAVWENGAERKPNKDEKDNHAQYLQDLVNAAPIK